MSDSAPSALLDRAAQVFAMAGDLGRLIHEERNRQTARHAVDVGGWDRIGPDFERFCSALLELRPTMEHPPTGLGAVVDVLATAAQIAQKVRNVMLTADGRAFAEYLDYFPEFNSIAEAGRRAMAELKPKGKNNDPFSFLDQSKKHKAETLTGDIDKFIAALVAGPDDAELSDRALSMLRAHLHPPGPGSITDMAREAREKRENSQAHRNRTKLRRIVAFNQNLRSAAERSLESNQKADGTKRYDPTKREPRTFGELLDFAAPWHAFNSRKSGPNLPVRANDPDHQFLELFCIDSFGAMGMESLGRLRAKYAVGTGKSVEEIHATSLHEMAEFFRPSGRPTVSLRSSESSPPDESGKRRKQSGSRKKRSTERGEGQEKLVAAFTKHHRYADGGSLNSEPIGNNELAEAAGVAGSTASSFFKDNFKGYAKYRTLCRDVGKLTAALKMLNNEFAPHQLLGSASAELAAPEEGDEME